MNKESIIVKPTIGRKVWFWPNGSHIGVPAAAQPRCVDPEQAMDATVVLDHTDGTVNLLVVDHVGSIWPIRSVTLRQADQDKPSGMYCEWMPYQTAQAKKDQQANTAVARTMTFGGGNASIATEASIEQKIQAKGLTAPRVTMADIEASIASEYYFTAAEGCFGTNKTLCAAPQELGLLTFCVLVLRNGTKIAGINYGAIDPAQHSAEQGRIEARAHAIEQIWPLMGYALREKLASDPL